MRKNAKLLCLITLCFFVATKSKTQCIQIPANLKNGLVAYYPFCGNANDISGNEHNGIVHGSVTPTTDRNGNTGSAYLWPSDGSPNNYIEIGKFDNVIPNSITISAWILMDGGVYDSRVISSGEQGIICNGAADNTYRTFKASYDASGANIWPSTHQVSALEWHHLVYAADRNTVHARFYVDGVLVDSRTANTSPDNLTHDIWNIGRKSIWNYNGWGGKIDDVGLWNRALSDSEITQLYDLGTCTPVTPAISITVSPGKSICKGTKVTFTAAITNGGTTPIYQWKKKGVNVGTYSETYVDSSLKTGDSIYCVLTSNVACATSATAKSNTIKMTVRNPVTPTVSITASPNDSVCTGNTVTFTAIIKNGGNKPIRQWKKNGVSVGTNSNTYVDATLKNGDSIYCVLASNASCVTTSIVNSNGIRMTVSSPVTPAISITASPGTSVCTGSKITFTATATNGGTSPVYQWKRNGFTVGINSKIYVDSTLNNGDSVYCILSSNVACATTVSAKSNVIKMTVSKPVKPTVTIAASPSTSVCKGSKVTFTAIATKPGPAPIYQWKKNGINVGTNSKTYVIDTALKNGDSIYCVLTSKAACATPAIVNSNGIKMIVSTCLLTGNGNQSSVKGHSKELTIIATPNPFANSFQLSIKSPNSTKAAVFITDMKGQKVFQQSLILNRGTDMIAIKSASWAAGIYYVQVVANSETKSCKVVKE